MLIWPTALLTGLQLVGQISRNEVFTTGHGSSLVMTPNTRRRTPVSATLTAAGAYLLLVIVGPLLLIVAGLTLGGPVGAAVVAAAVAYLFAIAAGPLIAAHGRVGMPDADTAARALLHSDVHVVRLHDLVRDPRDVAGIGVGLLHAVIHDPRFADMTVVTTAADPRLAAAYEAAGMTVLRGTTTLTRPPQTQQTSAAR